MDGLLPLGSIVKTKSSDTNYIIVGKNVKKDDKSFDYVCLFYPFGFVKDIDFSYLNEKEIDSVCFLGNINKIEEDL